MRLLERPKQLLRSILTRVLYYPYALRYRMRGYEPPRLHVGCGANRFPGWVNADIDPGAELIIFLQRRLPVGSGTLSRLYTEHVLEHVPYATAVFFLREARRALRQDGVLRIAMPDLDDLIDGYQHDWKRFDWVSWPDYAFLKTRAEMLNIAFRWWGHQHLYNREELERALREAGFTKISFPAHGMSEHPDLRGLETRADSKLIAEAVK